MATHKSTESQYRDAADSLAEAAHRLEQDAFLASPAERLTNIAQALAAAKAMEALTVQAARVEGLSWETIGGALGLTRQAAWERFGK